jgi:NAD(P)-dependent dehydrogenase (short-subunit alcohol dehydrogenase family)
VNAVLPGFTITPMTDVVPDKVKQLVTAMIPLGRMGNPEGMYLSVLKINFTSLNVLYFDWLI